MEAGLRSRALRVVIHGHLWLACGAAAQTWFMQDLMDRTGWGAPLTAALATFAGYTFMRLARAGRPDGDAAPHLAWAWARRSPLAILALAASLMALRTGWHHLRDLVSLMWPLAAIVALYAVPGRWIGGRAIGLRRVPLLKGFLITGSWTWLTVGLPVAFGGREEDPGGLGWLCGMQAAFFLAIALVFDLRDREQDRGEVVTWPQVLGVRTTRVLAVLLMFYPAAVFGLLAFIGRSMSELEGAPEWAWERVFAGAAYLLGALVITRSDAQRGPLFHGLVVDGLLILVPGLYAIGRWV
jgi:hypothetical protein